MAAPGESFGATLARTVWQQDEADPAAVEQAMRALERQRFQDQSGALPARALNLVVIVDAAFAGEIIRRLETVGRNAPSRTILLRVSPRRTSLGARVTLTVSHGATKELPTTDAFNELVTIDIGPEHVGRLDSIVEPVVMTDVPTLVWAPHGHRDALDAVAELSQSVLLDTSDPVDAAVGLATARDLHESHGLSVVDLAWLRANPWRMRLAAHYAPAHRLASLWRIREVEVGHHPGSEVAAWLTLGWLADRLHWSIDDHGVHDAEGHPVTVELLPVDVGVRGLAGTTVTSRDGCRFSLTRNPGGLQAHWTDPARATDQRWTVLGASRGEAGVLSSALRRTLVPDDGYLGALAAAGRMIAIS